MTGEDMRKMYWDKIQEYMLNGSKDKLRKAAEMIIATRPVKGEELDEEWILRLFREECMAG